MEVEDQVGEYGFNSPLLSKFRLFVENRLLNLCCMGVSRSPLIDGGFHDLYRQFLVGPSKDGMGSGEWGGCGGATTQMWGCPYGCDS